MCSLSSMLWSQLATASFLAICLVALGAIAVFLDRAARRANRSGASRLTVWLLEGAAVCLLVIDLCVLIAVAVTHAIPAIKCMLIYL